MESKIVTRSDWEVKDMPFWKAGFSLKRHFSGEEIQRLRHGHIPQEMEDKWFWYCENDTLYAHRSWTGVCIYIVKFDFTADVHRVTVNRNKKQYCGGSREEELRKLNGLLDRWVQPQYDYYSQWLDETAAALRQRGETGK